MSKLSHRLKQNASLGPIVMSICELIDLKTNNSQFTVRARQRKLSEVTDMIHAAHVFHRSAPTEQSSSKTLHQMNIMSLLVGDYLLAQSSVDMADLRCPRAVGLIAKGLEDYTDGEFLMLQLVEDCSKNKTNQDVGNIQHSIEQYAQLTCGSLLSNACLSAALLAGHPDMKLHDTSSDSPSLSKLVHAFGYHTGSAHRLREIFYEQDTNSENHREFIAALDPRPFRRSIGNHIDKASDILYGLHDPRQRVPDLLSRLDKIRCR